MFIAMNRFRVALGSEAEFEKVWLSRDVLLRTVPGFESFHLLRGPEHEDHVLYASHTIWASREQFEDWTRSDAFREAHKSAGQTGSRSMYLGPPQFEGFDVLQVIDKADAATG
ncbi:antibiotic biosynthesis monooxygenase family protein [Lichenicola sp.]|uniref:antibiotic biosynthesis monooxygenase family protein n=1 Tax=Lichenicola sp. TaxID=2804529 RepID=UPI003B002DEF